jgi:hypothetical protein
VVISLAFGGHMEDGLVLLSKTPLVCRDQSTLTVFFIVDVLLKPHLMGQAIYLHWCMDKQFNQCALSLVISVLIFC